MKKSRFFRSIVFILCFTIVVSSVMLPSVFAENVKDTVKPLYPFNISAVGGTQVNVSSADNLFTNEYTKALEISSTTPKNGIITNLDKLSVSVSGNGNVVTPLVSGAAFSVDSAVNVTETSTVSISSEKGFKVESAVSYENSGNLTTSKAGGYIEYSRKQSLVGADGILFYLKIEGANLVNVEIDPNNPENGNRWAYDWDPWLMLKKGASYSYIALNGSSWTTANAVAREGSDIFGAMQFNSSFEGYVKIPFTSLTNDCGFVFDSKLDSFEKIIVRTKGIGGSYGNFVAGPFFVLDKDSSSNTITVNSAEPSDALSTIGGKISGFKEPMADVQSVLLYVKTDSANRISVKANIADDYIDQMPDMQLIPGSTVYMLGKGENTWKQTKVVTTETLGAIELDSAFEGYIKLPVSCFVQSDNTIAVLPEIDYVIGFEFGVGGVGGSFGKVAVAPFLMTSDLGKCDFEIDSKYVKPTFDDIEAVPVTSGNYYSAGGTGYAEVYPLTWVVAKGVKITAQAETKKASAIESAMTSFGDYYTVNDTATKFFESDTVIIYVKTDGANELAIKLYDEAWNELFLKAGTSYSYTALGDDEWNSAQMKSISYSGKNYGVINFESAFEGYIKLSLTENLGTSKDTKFNYMYFYPMALGGQYGSVTAGPMFSVTKDTLSTNIKVADEYKPQPIEAAPLAVGNFYSANGGSATKAIVKENLDWLKVNGMEITAIQETAYETAALSMANSFGNYFTINDAAATYFTSDTVVFYVKTDAANDIAFKIYNQSWSEYFFKANTTYSYAALTDEFWSDATMKTASYGGTDYGVLSFNSAFEGYVKLNLPRNIGISSTDKFIYMYFYPKALGGQYGSVNIGPILSVTKDSVSTKINVDREFTADAIKASPIPQWSISNSSWETISAELTTPVAWTNVNGIKLTPKDGVTYEADANAQADTAWNNICADIEPDQSFGSETHLVFYVKTEAANAIVPKVYTKWGYLATPKMGATYHYAKIGDAKWSEATVVRSGSEVAGSSYHGSIVFEEAFEGFVKIKLSDLGHNDIGGIVSGNALSAIYVNYKGLGGAYGNTLTVGPFFLASKDSENAEIILPKEYRVDVSGGGSQPVLPPVNQPTPPTDDIESPVAERVANVLKYSLDGSQQGYYFAVGDNTRYHLGFPVYRLVANKLEKGYNIIPTLISSEKLTAKAFAETVADELIAKIQGEGKGAIVDISLGLYDEADANTTAAYINSAIAKIRAAKPYAVITYTTPNLVMDKQQNLKLAEVAAKVYENNSVFAIDVAADVFGEYYTQFYSDANLPNISGYRNIAKYVIAKYLGNSFEKIVTTDEATVTLPSGATLVNTDYKALNSVGISTSKALMKVGGEFAYGLVLEGKKAISGKRPYDSGAEILFELTKPVGGENCLMFYLDIPAANKIGLVAYKDNEKNVNEDFVMLLDNSEFDILADGQTEWKKLKTVKGSDVEGQLPGALEFTSAFKGWVRIPYKAFGLTGSLENGDALRALVVRVSELGGSYGNVMIGTFAKMNRPGYVAQKVWNKKDLPEMVPFTSPTSVTKYWEAFLEVTPSVTPTLTNEVGAWISCSPTIDKQGQDYMKSWFELYKNYDNMPIGDFTHLMFYVKVPETKENRLSICMFTETGFEFKIMANQPYALLQLGEKEWQHYLAEDVKLNNYGGIVLPAGFEGFIKVPMESLLPAKVNSETKLAQICFRFGYIGMNEEACLWGGTFGVTKDNDPGPKELVYTSLPAATTIKKMYAIDKGDIFPDKIMLYWQPLENAVSYDVEAYSVTRVNKGYEYRLVNKESFYTNSGTITGLEMGTSYAILIKAKDAMGNVLAIYEYVRVKTATENPYVMKTLSDEVKLDTVDNPSDDVSGNANLGIIPIVLICIGGAVVLGAASVLVIVLVMKKRRSANV